MKVRTPASTLSPIATARMIRCERVSSASALPGVVAGALAIAVPLVASLYAAGRGHLVETAPGTGGHHPAELAAAPHRIVGSLPASRSTCLRVSRLPSCNPLPR